MKNRIPGSPIRTSVDLRDMVRQYLILHGLRYIEEARQRRQDVMRNNNIDEYSKTIRTMVQNFYGRLPAGDSGTRVKSKKVSSFEKDGYRIENVLFDSFLGWEVNASVYIPIDYKSPFPAVVVPVGHSGKQFESYQLPCQFFARSGYLAVVFDPPGQAGEKQPGNDHFIDGVRCYLVGETSSRYFVADALRCIDYLETRHDANLDHGVAMTGVSGGGTTTSIAGLLDKRISVSGPSCCLTSLADLDITQCYAGCPETHMWGRYAEGIDELDLLCAIAPKPVLLMAGEFDEVFQINDTRHLAREVKEFYETAGAGDRFEFFIDKAGHGYSLAQAREFVKFMNRWLLNEPDRSVPGLPADSFKIVPHEELKCYPGTDVNMRSLTLVRANDLEKSRDRNPSGIRNAAAKMAKVTGSIAVPKAKTGESFRVWTHYWQQILLEPEDNIELSATLVAAGNNPAPAVLHFDDRHRNRLLCCHGTMAKAIRFQDDTQPGFNLFSVDLRGWGDSSPALYPYEMVSWGSIDKYLAYTTAALADSITAMRIRDGLAALMYLRSRSEISRGEIVITGCGAAGIVALHVAAIDNNIKGVLVWNSLASFRSLLEADNYTWPADVFIPNVLVHYDLPELTGSISSPVIVLNSLDGTGNPLSSGLKKDFDHNDLKPNRPVFVAGADTPSITKGIELLLSGRHRI